MENRPNSNPLLLFPEVSLVRRWQRGREEVWDAFRRRWLALGPEEWVRQHLAHYMVNHLGYPKNRLVIEKRLADGVDSTRLDLLLVGKEGEPLVLVECKAPQTQLSEEVWWQVLGYGMQVPAPVVAVTNGLGMEVRQRTPQGWMNLSGIPPADAWIRKGLTGK
ncbi:MAG: type I restriction enzyme HsdR N-terminal domain-containing protein [Cytophagia bacterium]|nr:type I restriction enzyme HsdR N-terminal domain-containing protein [Cytophagia bacterium]